MQEENTFNSLPEDVIFREQQQFRQPWLMLLLVFINIVSVVPAVLALIEFQHRDDIKVDAAMVLSLLVPVVIMASISILLLKMKLITEVRKSGLYIRFFPLHLSEKKISLDEVVDVQSVRYRPIREYGGWGIRYRFGKGKAYTVSGNLGVRLDMKTGRHLLIGSLRPDELADAVRTVLPASAG